MEDNKTFFHYITQVFIIFGFSMLFLFASTFFIGDDGKSVSSLYELGSKGITVSTAFQFLIHSIIIVVLRFIFFTDRIIKTPTLTLRTILMILSIIFVIALFAVIFNWFPIDMWQAWAGFLICFMICFVISAVIASIKEQEENKKLMDALNKIKKESKHHE